MKLCSEINGIDTAYVSKVIKLFNDKIVIDSAPVGTKTVSIKTNLEENKFLDLPEGLLITSENPSGYGGVTYVCGASTVYWTNEDKSRIGILSPLVLKLRIAHEILHHFDKDADDIDWWLNFKCSDGSLLHPILHWMYNDIAKKSGESLFGIIPQYFFYKQLYSDIDEERFNKDFRIMDRNFMGVRIR